VKIDKYIAQSGFCSRRAAIRYLETAKVLINGKIANFKAEVSEGDSVLVDGKPLTVVKKELTYIAYHKPKGIECTTEKIEGNIIDAIQHPENIFPIGRLDKNSEGLILLTNHGEIINKINHSDFEHEKEYIVTLNLPLRKKFLEEIAAGVEVDGIKTKPCIVKPIEGTKRIFSITLTQGMNRQIRKMCGKAGYQVIKLQRVRVMNIQLGKLKIGEWRDLTQDELNVLFKEIGYKKS
jgi:23S rRNA pseudouridine2604 synthase